MFHEGQTGSQVSLDTLLPNPRLYAVGALAGLAGEVTVIGGETYLSYPEGERETRAEKTAQSDAGAALLVSAEVGAWRDVAVQRDIPFSALDEEIATLAAAAGMDPGRRLPFLLEGEVEDLRWHVIDGSRLTEGGSSHHDHLAASVQQTREKAQATLLGFYSASDQGVFTHMDSKTHIHCVLADPLTTGHVDNVTIPAGTVIMFPVAQQVP